MRTINKHRLMATFIWLMVTGISLVYIGYNLSIVSDLRQFMPANSDNQKLRVLLHETQKGIVNNLILVQLKGASPEYLARLSLKLKNRLQKNNALFESIINGDQDINISPYQTLFKYRYNLGNPADYSAENLQILFKNILTVLRSGMYGESIKYLLLDPHQLFLKYLSAQSSQVQPEKVHGVWFDADRSKALLIIQMKSSGFDLDVYQAGIDVINNAFEQSDKDGAANIVVAGPGTIAVATRNSIRSTTQQVSWVLSVVILVLLWFGYGSIRLAIMAGIPLLTAIIAAITVNLLLFGELHGIVLAFGITMLGVGLDYPLHLFSHLRKNETAIKSLRRIWPTLRLSVLTSVLAYTAFIGTGFSGLTQLAVFSATGLLVALILTRWVIPVWVSADWANKRVFFVKQPFSCKKKIVVSILIIGFPLLILILQDNIWSRDISQISPVSSDARDTDRSLRRSLHATDVSHVFLLEGKNIDEVLIKTDKLKSAIQPAIDGNIISGVFAASDILPDKFSQQYNQSLLPDIIDLKKNVNVALEGLPFKKNAFENFIEAVSASKSRQPINYIDILPTPLGSKLKSMLFEQEGSWYSVIRVAGVNNEKAFISWVNSKSDIEPYYISIRSATNELMERYLQNAWFRFIVVLSLIALIVLWLTQTRKEAVWIFIPVIAGVVVSLAVQVMLGNLINIFHVLSLLLVVGMGLDYSLFFNREWKNEVDLQDRTHAIILSATTTVVAFGTLGLSDIPILAAMGQTVSVGILTCFFIAQRVAVPKSEEKV